MEQHVRSFTSFIRTVPPLPYPRADNPLPSIAPLEDSTMAGQPHPSTGYFRERTSSGRSWEVPENWNGPTTPRKESLGSKGTSSMGFREYSPLLPPTSPELPVVHSDSCTWPLSAPPGSPICSRCMQDNEVEAPPLPPRSPLRAMSTTSISMRSDPGITTLRPDIRLDASSPEFRERSLSQDHDFSKELKSTPRSLNRGAAQLHMIESINLPPTRLEPHIQSQSWQVDRIARSPRKESMSMIDTQHLREMRKKSHRKMSFHGHPNSWAYSRHNSVSSKQKTPARTEVPTSRHRTSESNVDEIIDKDIPVSNLISRLKHLNTHGRRRRSTEDGLQHADTSAAAPSLLPSPAVSSSLLILAAELAFFQDSSPSSLVHSQSSSIYDASTAPGTPREAIDLGKSRPIGRSSLQNVTSMYTALAQAPYSPSQSLVNLSESLPSSQDAPVHAQHPLDARRLLSSPPPQPHNPQPYSLPPTSAARSQEKANTKSHKRTDSATEEGSHVHGIHLGILDKAREARDAWKKSRRDAKHDKLKQSIRLLGPVDPALIARGTEQGRALTDGKLAG